MYKKEGLTVSDFTVLTDTGGWENANEKGKNKRTNTPEEMGIIEHVGIKWKIADNVREKSIKDKDIYFTLITHKDELNIIGKAKALKLQKLEEDDRELNYELQTLKDNANEQFNSFIKAQEIQEIKKIHRIFTETN